MNITKYEMHIHALVNPDQEIAAKYFICGNGKQETIERAIRNSDDETFKKYLDNKDYVIHVIKDEISEDEKELFLEMVKDDIDGENFFISKNK